MKSLHVFVLWLALCSALVLSTACERHPASQTIPGYQETIQPDATQQEKIVPAAQAATLFHAEKKN